MTAPPELDPISQFGCLPQCRWRERSETGIRVLFTVAGFLSVVIMALIILFLFKEGFGFFLRTEITVLKISVEQQSRQEFEFKFDPGKGPQDYLVKENDSGVIELFGADSYAKEVFNQKLNAVIKLAQGSDSLPRPRLTVEPAREISFAPGRLIGFISGVLWYPSHDPPDFGILSLLLGSVAVTLVAGLIAGPLGVGAALYLSEVASVRAGAVIKPVIELLASIPSVVLGFVGMVVLAPMLQSMLDIPSGLNLTTAAVMLALMAIPTITGSSYDALQKVPRELKEASLALGATHFETLRQVTMPEARAAMVAAVILGMSRAMGETMVVLMVAGGAAQIPGGFFDAVRPLPSTIAAEMGEVPAGSEHYFALFALGIVLFFVTLGFNLLAGYVGRRFGPQGAAVR